MPTRSRRRDPARAEARRRSRAAARGSEIGPGEQEARAPATPRQAPSSGFLGRLFPPAPPLPGRPDPLAGFGYGGPLRPLVEGLYLLGRNPLAWIVPGIVWALTQLVDPRSALGLPASLLSFAALMGAGWVGWQRPALFGAVAAALGVAIRVGIGVVQASVNDIPLVEPGSQPGAIVTSLLLSVAVYALFGLLAGWYGGYLRRRQAQASAQRQASARRR